MINSPDSTLAKLPTCPNNRVHFFAMLRLLTGKPGGRTCDGSDSFASTGRRYGHKSELDQSFYYRLIFPAGLSGNASIIIKCEGIMWSGSLSRRKLLNAAAVTVESRGTT